MSECLVQANAKRSPDRHPNDFYRTPTACVRALLGVERFEGVIWEPACGDGAISTVPEEAGHNVVSTDLVDRGYGVPGCDFLAERRLLAPTIITNPPFKLADQFVLHGLMLGARTVAMFHRTAWLEGRARYATLWSRHPPVRIWQFVGRHTPGHGDRPRPATNGAIAFAWFIFRAGNTDAPRLGWLKG